MRIIDLTIKNFRGVREGYVRFGTHSVLIGANNCGKTTLIEALTLLFGRDKLVRGLTEHDFFGSNPQPADRVRLIATISGFEGDDPAEHDEWFRADRGVPKWLDPVSGRLHAQREDETWRLSCQVAFAARFDRPSLEVETSRYFHDDDSVIDVFDEEVTVPLPSRLIRDLGLFLIPANRTWDRIMSFGSELFRRVVASGSGPPAEAVLTERDRLRDPTIPLELDPNLNPLVTEVNRELAGFFRSAPSLKLRLTSTDSDSVMEAVIPHYKVQGQSLSLPARRHGSGLVSLQWLLLLLQFGRQRAASNQGFWMALEEPELHVPPALQRRLVYRIQALSTQTIVSTHSPMVAAMANPSSLLLIRNVEGILTATPFQSTSLPANTPNAIRKLFQLNRIDTISALMHEFVLIPEGWTDAAWLRLLLRITDGAQAWTETDECHFDARIGLIPTHDAAVVVSYTTLATLHPQTTCLLDGDQEGAGYTRSLLDLPNPPATIATWPNDWSIEDVVGWIIDADESAVIQAISTVGDWRPAPASVGDLVRRLKSKDRSQGGIKGDQLAYEEIAASIGGVRSCVERARDLMNGLSDLISGVRSSRFSVERVNRTDVGVFQP